jgi:hypothetical protein
MKTIRAVLAGIWMLWPQAVFAAIGCTLSNPAEDLKYLFPEMTSYKENLEEFPKLRDGEKVFQSLRNRLGSDLDPIYETYETPYTVYSVYQGKTRIGIVHGVNVPGKGGVIQVFLFTSPDTGAIRKFFFQRLESPAAGALRDKAFRNQWEGLTLADFYKHDYYEAVSPGDAADKVGRMKAPRVGAAGKPDYLATLRGIRKNLILLDIFIYDRRFEPYFEKAQAAKLKAEKEKP